MADSVLRQGLERYLSSDQVQRLAAVRVGIAGCGGLGSNVALMLARSGIRQFTLVDQDVVDASNLNRQAYWPKDIGRAKVAALADRLRELDPGLDLDCRQIRMEEFNTVDVFASCPVVVEAVDVAETKAMLFHSLVPVVDLLVLASGLAGWGGPDMVRRNLGNNAVAVGDFVTALGPGCPPLAPRVTMAAALQADLVLEFVLGVCAGSPEGSSRFTSLSGGL